MILAESVGSVGLNFMQHLNLGRKDRILLPLGMLAFAAVAVAQTSHLAPVLVFALAALALGVLAAVVGEATDHLGNRLNAGLTGAVQSALGNLPELLFGIFALRAGLGPVVSAALVGSVLANILLVLGMGFVAGGLRHGPQAFGRTSSRRLSLLFLLGTAIIAIPSLTALLHIPVAHHEQALSVVASIVMLVLFAFSIPATLRGETGEVARGQGEVGWPLFFVVTVLLVAAVASGFVAEWFVAVLTDALDVLHISEAFAGFVIVAIVGNAVEHVVGVQLMYRNKPAYAVNIMVQSPLQILFVMFPLLVIASAIFGWGSFTLVLSPLLLSVLALTALVTSAVVAEGESTWLEGVFLVGLYAVIATAFWWG